MLTEEPQNPLILDQHGNQDTPLTDRMVPLQPGQSDDDIQIAANLGMDKLGLAIRNILGGPTPTGRALAK